MVHIKTNMRIRIENLLGTKLGMNQKQRVLEVNTLNLDALS